MSGLIKIIQGDSSKTLTTTTTTRSVLSIAASFERTAFITKTLDLHIYNHDESVLLIPSKTPIFRNVIHVSLSENHVLFLDRNHHLYGFGSNLFGQVGIPPSSSSSSSSSKKTITKPVNLNNIHHEFLSKTRFKMCSAGSRHSLAIDSQGVVYTWGCGELGELGTNIREKNTHDRVPGLSCATPTPLTRFKEKVCDISAGYAHNALVTSSGNLYTWGWGLYGQLGTNQTENSFTPEIVTSSSHISASLLFTSVSCGFWHTVALDTQGRVHVFGSGRFGQLGLGIETDKALTPQHVIALSEKKITSISSGSRHTVALTSTGDVFFWGLRVQSSRYDTNPSSLKHHPKSPAYFRPVQVNTKNKVSAITSGRWHYAMLFS